MHNHAAKNYNCPFCLLFQGISNKHVESIQSDIIFRNDKTSAFISSLQWSNNHGNVLIIPNEHFENIYDLPLDYARDIHEAAKTIAIAMKMAFSCDGVSTRQHNEPAGGQDVWHYHVHITPRYKNDLFYANINNGKLASPERRAECADTLRQHINKI
ncbi:MAG: HIT domain-containing protein [Chloroflexi bacterium]|nr:HIT domain-containing protein [Chloroflexota bacterium]